MNYSNLNIHQQHLASCFGIMEHAQRINSIENKSNTKYNLPSLPKNSRLSKVTSRPSFSKDAIQKQSNGPNKQIFQSTYTKALQLIEQKDQENMLVAFQMLYGLCDQIRKLPMKHNLDNKMLESVVINCWNIQNTHKNTHFYGQQSHQFIKNFTLFFEEYYLKYPTHKNGLSLLFLIQANEQYQQQMFSQSLKSCQQSIKYSIGPKNQSHLIKVEFLKTKIYAAMNNNQQQMQAIRKCLYFANNLNTSLSDQGSKQYIRKIKKNLQQRKQFLRGKQNESTKFKRKLSLNNIKNRSVSLKKQGSQKNIKFKQQKKEDNFQRQPKISSNNHNKTLQVRSASHSKHGPNKHTSSYSKFTSIGQTTKQLFPIDTKKIHKPTKLKKKPLKLQPQQYFLQHQQDLMEQIQFITPQPINHNDLLLARPKIKIQPKQNDVHSKKTIVDRQEQFIFQQKEVKLPKYEAENVIDQVQPVTHKQQLQTSYDQQKINYNDLVYECSKKAQLNLLKTILKLKNIRQNIQINQQFNYLSLNQINQQLSYRQIDINFSQRSGPNQTNDQIYQQKIYHNEDIDIDENDSVSFYGGVLSRFNFQIKIQKTKYQDQQDRIYKIISFGFSCIINQNISCATKLVFSFYNIYEPDISYIISQICCKIQHPKHFKQLTSKQKMLTIIAHNVLLSKNKYGATLVQKKSQICLQNSVDNYKCKLINRFIIYELNTITNKIKLQSHIQEQRQQCLDFACLNKKSSPQIILQNHNKHQKQLKRKQTKQFKEQLPVSAVSMKRLKTQKFKKDTIFSCLSTIKTHSDSNTNQMISQTSSISLAILPSNFATKITDYFEPMGEVATTSVPEFYYCMKFLLIKPSASLKNGTIATFYDILQIQQLHKIYHHNVKIRMTAYRMKALYKKSSEIFFKFDIQFKQQKMKSMKFIATTQDLKFLNKQRQNKTKQTAQKTGRSARSAKKNRVGFIKDQDQIVFTHAWLSKLLFDTASKIFIKKNYIYQIIGFQTKYEYFSLINKFRLEGKTMHSKNFMIPHLKHLHIMLQKAIKIKCELFKQFAVLTIQHFEWSQQFSLIFYMPKLKRNFSVNLNKKLLAYIPTQNVQTMIKNVSIQASLLQHYFFYPFTTQKQKRIQSYLWNTFLSFFRFQVQFYGQNTYLVLKIGNFSAFLKDLSFSEYLQLNRKIFHLQISLSKHNKIISEESTKLQPKVHLVKRKSSSSKQILRNSMMSSGTNRNKNQQKIKKKDQQSQQPLFNRLQLFQKLDQIFQTKTNKYLIYLSITQLHDFQNQDSSEQKKINFSFYLSDLINLLHFTKGQIQKKRQQESKTFNQQTFSFAVLMRAMTAIKYKLIDQLKKVKIQQLYQGDNIIINQKIFKNNLINAFGATNHFGYSLNTTKGINNQQQNSYLLNKNIINLKKSLVVSTFLQEKDRKITFIVSNNSDLTNRMRTINIDQMYLPWIEFYSKEHLFTINNRIYKYYKNILLLV